MQVAFSPIRLRRDLKTVLLHKLALLAFSIALENKTFKEQGLRKSLKSQP